MTIHFWGEMTVWCAFASAFLQSVLPLYGTIKQNPYALAAARPAARLQCFAVCAAFGLLTLAFITDDFTLSYTAANSHPALPFLYKLTATWGAHEGSILLWILILNIWTMVFAYVKTPPLLQALTISVLGIISFCFLGFLIFTSDPFAINEMQQIASRDLNPLLQDPGLISHPPMLYMGYVGFSVAFALTLAALILNQLDNTWAKVTRQFATLAFVCLTLGILLGSLWAYRVLGWGGFWFWDPVENASLLPWLSGTALIHSLILVEKRHTAVRIAVILALISFSLSLLGTFLVRSGVLISAHTFANDPKRGIFLLFFFALFVSVALLLFCLRLSTANIAEPSSFKLLSRETKLLFNSAILTLAMLTVLIGTLYPLLIDALQLGAISVGPPYFNSVMLPLNIVAMFFMGIAPFCKWQQHQLRSLLTDIWLPALISFVITLGLCWSLALPLQPITLVNLCLCFWIIASVINHLRLRPAMTVAHTGFALLILGLVLSSMLSIEREVRMKVGNGVDLGPYHFFFIKTLEADGKNYRGIQGVFEVMKHHHTITYLYPEKRFYPVRDMVMTKVDIHPSIFRDLYIALGEPFNENEWSLRIYYKPFIRFIWLGGLLIAIGGMLSIFNRRRPIHT